MAESPQIWNTPLDCYYVRTTEDADGKQIQHMTSGALAVRYDDVGSGVSYVGEALPGTAITAAAWRIKKVTDTGDITVEWADYGRFSQVWDDRVLLTYA